ncbi:nuclear transport factor 2 family protein [Xanthomonas floridensis]|uniref:Nuclear transport factor 2 family protein n=1 Tax=Xanthomonas floridensis TaxID=1843580 RepID=A0ABU5Q1J9_9XANT|nr:nuclear transport factor 2 family protein [Xanthomonas floridensis]MEA5125663.1 nuclear transport factor 2 family protein [Xanthomonas floridensis]MEA5133538.1 nuclear transport factor 2 family protein [Xanthomonas floridensis]
MSLALPTTTACFFVASTIGDAAVRLPHLAEDAVVHDERQHHRGAAAIAAWLAQTQATTPYRAVPLGVHTQGEQVRVTAQVSGDPAGPAAAGAYVSAGGWQECGVADSLTRHAGVLRH